MWKVLSRRSWREYRVQASLPYRSVLSTHALYTTIPVFFVNMALSHNRFPSRAITDAAVQLIQVSDVTIRDVQICKMRWLVILAEIVIVLQKSARWQRKLYIRKLINMTLVPCNSCT